MQSATVAPTSFNELWHQRLRWFGGWLHNTLSIHRNLMSKLSWLSSLLWHCYIFEFAGAIIDILSFFLFPILFWFAPDPILFGYNLVVFIPYGLLLGVISQSIALRFTYGEANHKNLLFYTPLYFILRIANIFARSKSMIDYLKGNNGKWRKKSTQTI